MALTTNRKVTLALGVGAALMALIGAVIVFSMRRLVDAADWVAHTHEVRSELAAVRGGIAEAEAASHASIVARDTTHFARYRAGVQRADSAAARVRALTADDPEQQRLAARLEPLVAARRERLGVVVTLARFGRTAPAAFAPLLTGGQALTARIDSLVAVMEARERELLQQRTAAQANRARQTGAVALGLVLLAGGLALVARRSILRDIARRVEAERALRASEQRFHAIFDQTFQFTGLLTPGGEILEINETALAFVGVPRAELIGRALWDLPWESDTDREMVRSAVRDAAGGAFVRSEGCLRGGDGFTVMLDLSFKPVRDDAGEVVMIIPEARDITERKAAEAALRASEAKFSGILAIAADAVVTTDEAQTVVHFNRGAEEIFGYSAEEVIGRPLELLLPERVRGVHHEHVAQFARSGEASRRMGARREVAGRRKDGTEFPAEASISKLEHGGRMMFTAVLRDVTESRRAADRDRFLAEAGATLAASLDYEQTLSRVARLAVPALGDACVVDIYTADGAREVAVVADVDPEREDAIRRIRDRFPPLVENVNRGAPVRDMGRPLLLPEITPELVAHATVDDEHRRLVEQLGLRSAMFVPLTAREHVLGVLSCYSYGRCFDEDDLALAGELARRAALAIDNARLYAAAQHATRARDEVLGVVSHDLRTPLSTVSMCARALLDPEPAPADAVRAMGEVIQQSAEWAQRIIRDLLDVTSIDAGRLWLDRAPVRPAELLAAAREMFLPQAQQSRLDLRTEADPALPPIDADRERILQVVFNLLGNAVKFTPAGGRVSVAAALDDDASSVRFSVTDTGPGIAAEYLPHLFDRFWQVHHTRRGGAGLGLAIAKGIVEAHRGEIVVESAVGVGTTFTFTVPLAAGHTVVAPSRGALDAEQRSGIAASGR